MWAEKYVGTSYAQFNCAEIAQYALAREFDYDLLLPQIPRSDADMHRSILKHRKTYQLTENPHDGAIVIMRLNGRMCHIGIFCMTSPNIKHSYVLHAMQSMGQTILTRVCDLKKHAIKIMEFRNWQ